MLFGDSHANAERWAWHPVVSAVSGGSAGASPSRF
jgi:hypothetical protein